MKNSKFKIKNLKTLQIKIQKFCLLNCFAYAFCILTFAFTNAHAVSVTDSRSASVSIPSTFSLSFKETPNLNFGNAEAGTSSPPFDVPGGGLKLLCKSNTGNKWYLKVSDSGDFTHTQDPGAVIDNRNFRWYGTYTDGSGDLVNTAQNMSVTPATVYTSTVTEGNNLPAGTEVQLMFGLVIPNNVKAGTYQTTVIFTMTE